MPSLSTLPLVIRFKEHLIKLNSPLVMGIINATPDSFYASSRLSVGSSSDSAPDEAIERAKRMLEAGADILDIGACSTRPGSQPVEEEEEMKRLEQTLGPIREAFPEAILSVDTFRASIAEECIRRWNVDIINDISGGADPDMFAIVAANNTAYVLMHMRGTPADMDARCIYENVVAEVVSELAFRLDEARQAGICDIIIDPGFGFAKNETQNLTLLKHLDCLSVLGCPILAGISRKRMTGGPGNQEKPHVETIALNAIALFKGASIIRVHDVAEAVATANIIGKLWNLE